MIIPQNTNNINTLSTPILSKLGQLKSFLLDFLFPVFCVACHREGAWICESCLRETKIQNFQQCPSCEDIETEKGQLCRHCREKRSSHLDAMIVATTYDNPAIKKLIHNLKYRFVFEAAKPLSELVCRSLILYDCPIPDLIVPVPLHPRRLRWRGFNQSQLLASHVSAEIAPHLNIEVLDILERKKHNSPQMEIKNYRERLRNVQDIFRIKPGTNPSILEKRSVLLLDDIATTGATLEECAKILKSAGARKVTAAVIARQSLKK